MAYEDSVETTEHHTTSALPLHVGRHAEPGGGNGLGYETAGVSTPALMQCGSIEVHVQNFVQYRAPVRKFTS